MSLPKGLVYNPEQCSLLVFSSNCSARESHQHNSDKDAESIFSVVKKAGLVKDGMARLVTTGEGATKKGLEEAIKAQMAKITSDEEGLFIFVYCGGGCDLRDHGLALKASEPDEEGFVTVDSDKTKCMHSLVLKGFDPQKAESYMSGGDIADIIVGASVRPEQMLVILDCPCAQEISEDLEAHLRGRLKCELTLIVSQEKNKSSHCLRPLGMSTFSYFFSKFLSEDSAKTVAGTNATLYFKSMYPKVSTCCEALSSLRMAVVGLTLKPSTAPPEARFVRIIEDASKVMERIEQTEGDQVDGGEETDTVGKFLQKFYKSGFFTRRVRLCDEAKDWVLAVMRGPLSTLKEQEVLEDEVLRAAIGSMMFSVATIQTELNCDSISNSNIFIQGYVHVFAAVAIHIKDLDIFNLSLLQEALEFYMEVLRAKELSESNIKELKNKVESCNK